MQCDMLETAPLRFEPDGGGVPGRFVARGTRFHFEFSKNQAVLRAPNKAVSLQFEGANKQARMEGADLLRSKTNLFLGDDPRRWRSSIANYGRLQVRGLYPGIDLIYYGNAGELEYDLRMKPGADPRKIRLRLQGDIARLDRDGALVAELIQKRPVAYQIDQNGARVPVASRYRRNRDGSYGFALGAYDHRRELVIDPVLTLSLYLAGSSEDIAYAIGHDKIGFLYVGGETFSTDFPVTSNATQATLAGGSDIFMAKIDPHAAPGSQIVYATYIGGALNETFGGMAVGPNGDVYLTGSTISTDFPTVNAFQTSLTNPPNTNAFVVWINASQGLAYSSYLGGSSIDTATRLPTTRPEIYGLWGQPNPPISRTWEASKVATRALRTCLLQDSPRRRPAPIRVFMLPTWAVVGLTPAAALRLRRMAPYGWLAALTRWTSRSLEARISQTTGVAEMPISLTSIPVWALTACFMRPILAPPA